MARLRSGDEYAATQVWQRYVDALVTVAYRHLDKTILSKVDAEDVVQSAYRSFFLRFREGKFDVADWESMWGLLLRITQRKCGRRVTHFRAQRRDSHRERPLACASDSTNPAAIDQSPSPPESAIISELFEQLVADMGERERNALPRAHRTTAGWRGNHSTNIVAGHP